MEPTADQVRVLAGALNQLRSASTPTARVQAVRTATRAVQGLAVEDRQVLLERLLAHGAPVAAGAVSRHLEDVEVPPAAQTAIAQDLLGLAPVEAARIAEELLAASPTASARVSEPAWAPPSSPPDPDLPPPVADPVTRGASVSTPASDAARSTSSDPGGPATPPPLPRSTASRTWSPATRSPATRSPLRHRSPVPARQGSGPAPSRVPTRRPARSLDPDRWSDLATALADAPDARARRDLLALIEVPLPGDRLPSLLAAVPPGWQQRMVLRHLLVGPGIDGLVPGAVLEVLERDGDRFAVAARLARAGLAEVDTLAVALPDRLASRLRRRATVR